MCAILHAAALFIQNIFFRISKTAAELNDS